MALCPLRRKDCGFMNAGRSKAEWPGCVGWWPLQHGGNQLGRMPAWLREGGMGGWGGWMLVFFYLLIRAWNFPYTWGKSRKPQISRKTIGIFRSADWAALLRAASTGLPIFSRSQLRTYTTLFTPQSEHVTSKLPSWGFLASTNIVS